MKVIAICGLLQAVAIVGRAITVWEAIQKRSLEPIYKSHTKNEAKILRATTFAKLKLSNKPLKTCK